MSVHERFFANADEYLSTVQPRNPILFFSASKLIGQHKLFKENFPGEVTFAVKAHPNRDVIETLATGGMGAFDVASPAEMALVRSISPLAVLHYNNPIRSKDEIRDAIDHGVASYSIDRMGELEKLLSQLTTPVEISVRLKLETKGGKIDFGSKFGADEDLATKLLMRVKAAGHKPAMCFHPGTQCLNADAWREYIHACARVSRLANVSLDRLNVGGGFPSQREEDAIDLQKFFDVIKSETKNAFGHDAPTLLCEPGRAMVAEAFALTTRVKAICDNQIFLNDGIYGGLSEMRDIGSTSRIRVQGQLEHSKDTIAYVLFGPTCDSLDVLPDPVELPTNIAEGDYIIFDAMGAYSAAIATRFNGYGEIEQINLTD